MIDNNAALQAFIEQGNSPKFVYFWGHQKSKNGISKSCFSQWFDAPFTDKNKRFATAEHYMMYAKATLFNDHDIAAKVLTCRHPNEAKKLGRQVKNFDEQLWNAERFNIVVKANLLKFAQNPELKAYLLGTSNRVIVEASPVDKIWGVGLAEDNPLIVDPKNWQGLNLLGYALMVVREELA
ncbi:NADAR family protein [Pseudoalteromonas luteoviolacea]|uniref:NADAR family protein n=1 Tax=Pseudoalteromonas luteoviolacea TaxID=43657 RepID=UPI001B39C573|nr:NADAR family protein [Pseudoalteromonas luteoviolacea]MBQ4810899.1 NADAR family protein [Pseudoalteromonas luteoviolacea]